MLVDERQDSDDLPSMLHELIELQVDRTPAAIAVEVPDRDTLTYADLDARANQLAHFLRARGVGADSLVGICAERSSAMVVGLLGILKAGGAYVPIDPDYPAARRDFLLRDSAVALVLTQRSLVDRLPSSGPEIVVLDDDRSTVATYPEQRPGPVGGPDDLAYVIYTSGSTGRPKGVMVTHRAVGNRLRWAQDTFALGAEDAVLQKTPYSFDVSVWEFFWTLLSGARLVMARPDGHRDAAYLAEVINRYAITTVHFVPSMLRVFLEEPVTRTCVSLRRVICSGEALPFDLRGEFFEHLEAELHNLYGPTEAAVDVSWWDCGRTALTDVVPIGYPVARTRLLVLDDAGQPVPDGIAGELYIGGVQLARGYLNRPELTAERFIEGHPAAGGGRLYRTGDRARIMADGAIEYLGRTDDQVKIKGFRIEPGEVAYALATHDLVRDAVVLARTDGPGGARLVAYFTAARPELPTEHLREHLAGTLPAHLVPAEFVQLDRMPLTPNGKVDRQALPRPARSGAAVAEAFEQLPPRQQVIAEAFAAVLGVARIDPDVSFLAAGGDSLAAIRAVRRIPGATVSMVMRHPTVRGLAAAMDDRARGKASPLVTLGPGHAEAPRSLICLPYAAGSALSYRQLAAALPSDIAVRAAALPGHDFGQDEPLRPVPETVDAILAASADITGRISVYGHCNGVAMAVEVTRRLEASGREVERLFLGGSFPFPRPEENEPKRYTAGEDPAIIAYLQTLGGFQEVMEADELAFVMRNFHHDVAYGEDYFTRRYAEPEPQPLRAPVTFVVGGADPYTRHYETRWTEWTRFSRTVEVAEVPGANHYFLQHDADVLATVIRSALPAAVA